MTKSTLRLMTLLLIALAFLLPLVLSVTGCDAHGVTLPSPDGEQETPEEVAFGAAAATPPMTLSLA